jgi:hypothetical protein
VNTPPFLPAISSKTVTEGTLLIFTNSATDSDVPANALTYSLAPGAPSGATVNPTNGVFTWTPTETQGPGTNSITMRVLDNGSPSLNSTQTFTVFVLETNSPPTLAPITDRSIHQGTTLTLTNTATDSDIPANVLTFSLGTNAPAGSSMNSASGVFAWTPAAAYANTVNPITIKVTDNGTPNFLDQKSFVVTVFPRPLIESVVLSNSSIIITWTAITGQLYRVQYNEDLSSTTWNDLPPDVTATASTASKTDSIQAAPQRFYRAKVLP